MPIIFFDTNALYIEGYRDSFTAGSLTADFTERGVGVRVLHGTDYLVNDPWQNYAHPDGSQFASGDDLMAYLNAQFAMRRKLPPTITTGGGMPVNETGTAGDLYIDAVSGDLYRKEI